MAMGPSRPATPDKALPAPYGDAQTKGESATPHQAASKSHIAYPAVSVPAPYGDFSHHGENPCPAPSSTNGHGG